MSTIQVARPNQLGDVYDLILAPLFPADTLVDRASFMHGSTWGEVLVSEAPDGALTGAAVADHLPNLRLSVLEYLALDPGHRAQGTGTELFRAAIAQWVQLVSPGAFLVEIARPDAHDPDPAHGDPDRRVAFYDRLGVRALALPYYQPALSPEQRPVPDMVLGILVLEASWLTEHGTRFTEGARLEALLQARNPSPTEAELVAWEALLEATREPAGIEVLPLTEYGRVPRSGPIG